MNKLIALTFVLLIVIFLFIYVNSQKTLPMFSLTAATTPQPTVSQMKNEVIYLVIKKNTLVAGPQTLQVTRGQMVILNVTADQTEAFYFHGYNKRIELQKGKTVVVSFLATMPGHFEYELPNTHTTLGTIDVSSQ